MKKNYTKNKLQFALILAFIFVVTNLSAQNILFSYENAQNTNDGIDDYLEADIMVQTVDGMADFILGSVQMYFNYNPAAFGPNIKASGNFVSTQPVGSILGEAAFGGGFPAYQSFVNNDNTSSRVSFSCQPALANDFQIAQGLNTMVTSTPKFLFHIKVKYEDFSQSALFSFEDNEDQANGGVNDCRDQNYTACGGTTTSDCFAFPGTQIQNANFVSTGISTQVLATPEFSIVEITLYPNPSSDIISIKGLQESASIFIYDMNGKEIRLIQNYLNESIDVSPFNAGVYMIKIINKNTNSIKRLIVK
ncbi:MAG: T9SS type A sorting domain-containing protein [Flavobacteriaceae bacterium]